ncbi:hypothetical protein O3P69_000011 [Scylla paramamosain]|uniref:Uncharacterized protein n=1 Tax=Scylla paramamosain TaxID=85552 RepID=A0AAW0UVA6_SCYPA
MGRSGEAKAAVLSGLRGKRVRAYVCEFLFTCPSVRVSKGSCSHVAEAAKRWSGAKVACSASLSDSDVLCLGQRDKN